MENIYNKINVAINNCTPAWLTTVTNVTGSTPAAIGMKMLVYADGSIYGTIGGGEIEKKVIEKIVSSLPDNTEKISYNLGTNNESAETTNMVCGGVQEILIEPLLNGTPLYIIGGGHCGMALSSIASKSGFFVTVIDNRLEWANKDKHPGAVKTICSDYDKINEVILNSKDAFVVIMTHGHIHDQLVLEQLLNRECKYLGMIGSKRKVKILIDNLIAKGYNKETLKSVFAPLGLVIGTHTPDEIAVSITAQMIAVKNGLKKIKFNQNPLL